MSMPSKKILFRFDPAYKKCPSCGEINTLRRSRTKNVWESILKATGIYKMYRCRKCNWRGALSTIIITSRNIKNISIFIVIMTALVYLILLISE